MSLYDTSSREELRQAYADAWRKQRAGAALSPLEELIAAVIAAHPEYQRVVDDRDASRTLEADVTQATTNPFLHMGLHLAVREQVSIDRPPGIRALETQLRLRHGDSHHAEHLLMDALAETLWDAQRAGRPPDEARYLELARHKARTSAPP